MPANLSPDHIGAERDYKSAQTAAEKVAALERMLATIPGAREARHVQRRNALEIGIEGTVPGLRG